MISDYSGWDPTLCKSWVANRVSAYNHRSVLPGWLLGCVPTITGLYFLGSLMWPDIPQEGNVWPNRLLPGWLLTITGTELRYIVDVQCNMQSCM